MTEVKKETLLSPEFQVAVAIYELTEVKKGKAWQKKLQEVLHGNMSSSTVSRMLKFLESWHIIKVQYGETETGRPGRLYYISNEDTDTIKNLYERYWR